MFHRTFFQVLDLKSEEVIVVQRSAENSSSVVGVRTPADLRAGLEQELVD